MGKKKLSTFKTFLALMSNEKGFLRLPVMLLNGDPEGGGGTGGDPDPKPETKPEGTYPKEFVEKLMREKQNWKTKAQELEEKVKTIPEPKPGDDPKPADEELKAMLKEEREKRAALEARLKSEEEFKKSAMKLGAVKKEFLANGGDEKAFALVSKLVDTEKVMIDEESGIVYGAETALKAIKEQAPQLFTKPKVGTHQSDIKPAVDPADPKSFLDGKRNKKDKETGSHPLVDFYASHGITLKK